MIMPLPLRSLLLPLEWLPEARPGIQANLNLDTKTSMQMEEKKHNIWSRSDLSNQKLTITEHRCRANEDHLPNQPDSFAHRLFITCRHCQVTATSAYRLINCFISATLQVNLGDDVLAKPWAKATPSLPCPRGRRGSTCRNFPIWYMRSRWVEADS